VPIQNVSTDDWNCIARARILEAAKSSKSLDRKESVPAPTAAECGSAEWRFCTGRAANRRKALESR
jgi:hypothetical protein